MSSRSYVTVDVAHPPLSSEEAELLLDRMLREPGVCAMKIIHGYGSGGSGGILKETVRNWAYRRRAQVQEVIDGGRLSLLHPAVEALIKELRVQDPDLSRPNDGLTVIRVR